MLIAGHRDHEYAGIRREFIFKVDGNRPVLYALEYTNPRLHYLSPNQGFALSLINGRRTLGQANQVFATLAPGAHPQAFTQLLESVESAVRRNPSTNGFGKDGVLEWSTEPVRHAPDFDPRDFVVEPAQFKACLDHPKTRLRLQTPINIYTVFTHHCFTRCLYCYAHRPQVPEMSLDRWREIVAEMSTLGIHLASPDNGDTFARPDGIDFLECLLEHEMHFLLSTKAFVSREYVARLVEAGFDKPVRGVVNRLVQLSVDAVQPEISKRLLGVGADRTDLMKRTLDNFLSFGIMPKVKGVITGLNYTQPRMIVEALYPRGARVFNFVRYRRTFHRHQDDLFVAPAHLVDLRQQFDDLLERYPDIELQQEFFPEVNPDPNVPPPTKREVWANRLGCGGGWNSLGISADGKAFLCEQMPMADPYLVGDARKQSIAEIWSSEALRDFIFPVREQFDGRTCQTCPEFEECMWAAGRCYRDAFFNYGSVFDQPPACPRNDREALRLG